VEKNVRREEVSFFMPNMPAENVKPYRTRTILCRRINDVESLNQAWDLEESGRE
jgi:hypothetical protein